MPNTTTSAQNTNTNTNANANATANAPSGTPNSSAMTTDSMNTLTQTAHAPTDTANKANNPPANTPTPPPSNTSNTSVAESTPVNMPTSGFADDGMITREVFEQMMRQKDKALNEMRSELVEAKQAVETTEDAKRSMISEAMDTGSEYLKTISEDAPLPQKEAILSLLQERANIDKVCGKDLNQMMKVASVVHCASMNQSKRSFDDSSIRATKEELRTALQKNEENTEALAKKERIISELQAIAAERQASEEELSRRLCALTGAARRYDFAIPQSRVSGLASNSGGMNATARAAANLAAAHMAAQPQTQTHQTPQTPQTLQTPQTQTPQTHGIPSKLMTGGAGGAGGAGAVAAPIKMDMGGGLTNMVHAASVPATTMVPTPEGFASWAMSAGNGSDRITRNATGHHLLGGDADGAGPSSSNSVPSDIEALIRASEP
mgnify:CR=1 FL=1